MKAYYTIEVRDQNGKLLSREKRKSRSYVQQWNELINVQARGLANVSIKDITGTDRNIDPNIDNLNLLENAGSTNRGIVVGRGSTAVAIDDYELEAICAEGTGTNQLNYHVSSGTAASVSGSSCSFTLTRSAINNSGATITVTEIGFHTRGCDGGTPHYFLAARDVLASSQAVPDGGAITVVYTIKVTV